MVVFIANDFFNANDVADGTFQSNTEITSITLPNTVTSISANAFNGANALTTIYALGANAFNGTTSIIPSGIKLTGSANIDVDQAASWGTTVDSLFIQGSSPIIPDDGFFADTNNIIIIACAAGGSLLLIGGIVTGVLVYRKNANGSNFEEKEAKLKLKDEAKDEAIKRLKIEQRLKDAKKNK